MYKHSTGNENSPHVIMNADVNCDTITLTVDGVVYKLDYGFGRLGVRDLGGWRILLRDCGNILT